MALNAYMRLTGEKQGEIRGPVTRPDSEDSIKVIAVEHNVLSLLDAASGLPTGKRQHKPLTITKEIDMASPLLMNMMVNNENITDLEIRFWRAAKDGHEEQFYTIQLYNASISDIQLEMLNNQYPENIKHKVREHVSFCYQKIIWTYEDGGITAADKWEARSA